MMMHLRCSTHIINLVVRDGMEEQHEAIVGIRNAVRYVRTSPARLAKFKECVELEGITYIKNICLDVDTRWNSTYLILESAEKYEKAFDRLRFKDDKYSSFFFGGDEEEFVNNTRVKKKRIKVFGAPKSLVWQKARFFIEFLRIFYNVTIKIAGSKYVTSNLFFNELVNIHDKLVRMCSYNDEKCLEMALKMKKKYDKYWKNIDNVNFLLYVAVVLDPRKKMSYLVYFFQQLYKDDAQRRNVMKERVEKTMLDLFKHYKSQHDKTQPCASSSSPVCLNSMEIDDGDIETHFLKDLDSGNKTEIEIFFIDGYEKHDANFDILYWWKMNSSKFPILNQLARNVLAMPISTVASESAFSTGGRVIDSFRSSLTPRTAEVLICVKIDHVPL